MSHLSNARPLDLQQHEVTQRLLELQVWAKKGHAGVSKELSRFAPTYCCCSLPSQQRAPTDCPSNPVCPRGRGRPVEISGSRG
eukprot:350017-Chlamydomonas_euryale.AAC.1